MIHTHNHIRSVKSGLGTPFKQYFYGSIFLLLVIAVLAVPSYAQEPELLGLEEAVKKEEPAPTWVDDPFSSKRQGWVTLDGYDDKVKEEEELLIKQAEEARRQAAIANFVKQMETPAMPGINIKKILSALPTEDIEAADFYSSELYPEGAPREWINVDDIEDETDMIRKAKRVHHQFSEDGYDIRLPTLPDTSIRAASGGRVMSSRMQHERRIAAELKRRERERRLAEKKKKEAEACKTISDYRKRQLAAMESDRATLAALREALSELGLTKELEFMDSPQTVPMTRIAPKQGKDGKTVEAIE